MARADELAALIRPAVEAVGYEMLGVEFISAGKHSVLRVYIDSPQGISVDDCAQASYQISGILDVEDPIPGEYRLEVSSPGADRPLFTAAHFARFVGHEAKVKLHAPIEGRRNFKGRIVDVKDEIIVLNVDGETVEFEMDAVERANLVPTW
ncbi:MAG: ribosome maturation factor RimP [Gammaproteobacteria bacterium]|nr:MAG: ribosome maturation factor RimP [Gammaproteobacteria bacterium]